MRQYDMAFGILLVLSIINFALAAPVPEQKKPQTCVNVLHTPRDVTTVLEKRGDEELEKLAEFFEKWRGAHASSSSAPQGLEDGLMNDVQASSSAPPRPEDGHMNLVQAPALTEHGSYGSDDELTGTHMPQPNSSPRPSTDSDSESEFDPADWDYFIYSEDPHQMVHVQHPPWLQEDGVAHVYQVDDVQQPNGGPIPQENGYHVQPPNAGPPPQENGYHVQQPNGGPPPQENGVAHGYQVDGVQQPNAGPPPQAHF